MSDWGPVFMAVVLFILLTPGLLFQVPGRHRCVEFGNFQTSGASIMVHTLLYFSLICVFLLAVKVHLYLDKFGASSHNNSSFNNVYLNVVVKKIIVRSSFHHKNIFLSIEFKLLQFHSIIIHPEKGGGAMSDWGPVVLAVVLFVLLSPGLLFQLPGRNRVVEFGNMQTSGLSILVHTIIFFGLITIFLIAIGVHIYTG
ncbi:transmembrane protein [Salix suchowensis]|nr:transmembrane protein [Salix suchowensis]